MVSIENDKLLNKYKLSKKFGYGGVSEEFVQEKCNLLKRLEDPEYFVTLWEAVGCQCGGYNGELDELLLDVVKSQLAENTENNGIFLYGKDASEEIKSKIELINYILCSADLLDYGTSPRFPFISPFGRGVFDLYFKQVRPDWLDEDDI